MMKVQILLCLIGSIFNFGEPHSAYRTTILKSRGSSSHRSHHLSMKRNNVEAWLDYNSSLHESAFVPNYNVDCVLGNESCVSLKESINIKLPQSRLLSNKDGKIFDKLDRVVGATLTLETAADQNRALSLVGSVEWIALRCTGTWKMIPVENLIAACDGTATKLAVYVDSADNLPGVLFSLELGPHAVILPPTPEIWIAFSALQSERSRECKSNPEVISPRLEAATVMSVVSGGVGDRVCIDLIQLLRLGEGLLIGSSSKILALVHGETFEGEYVPSRPFRVNAGPVHSYVLMADGSTKYLSEVAAGDSVMVIDASKHITATNTGRLEGEGEGEGEGNGSVLYLGSPMISRAVTVGRCKIETRPMLMVSYFQKSIDRGRKEDSDSAFSQESYSGQIFLQQAETVRLIAPTLSVSCIDGKPVYEVVTVPVTQLKSGDSILILRNDLGTHVGSRISANVLEK